MATHDFIIENGILKKYTGVGGVVTVPENVTVIGSGAFFKCFKLIEIILPESLIHIDRDAFFRCCRLTKVNIPQNVKTIDEFAFSQCRNLRQVNLPPDLQSIGNSAFYDCQKLKEISVPPHTILGKGVFENCRRLAKNKFIVFNDVLFGYIGKDPSPTLPDGIKRIDINAFTGNEHIRSIRIPNGVETINSNAFLCCSNLETVSLPDSITLIDNVAFFMCRRLKNINVPAHTQIGDGAFHGCDALANDHFIIVNNILFGYVGEQEHLIVPPGVTRIDDISSTNGPKEITLPEGITVIRDRLFQHHYLLEKVYLPKSLRFINEWAFCGCLNLRFFKIPDGVESIGIGAFEDCSELSCITIPNSVTFIGEDAFKDCNNLTIYAPAESYAEKYAKENNIPFMTR